MKTTMPTQGADVTYLSVQRRRKWAWIIRDYQYYILLLPAVVWYATFAYGPLYGLQIAFKRFNGAKGILGSQWVGLRHFTNFINSYFFTLLLRNTLALSIYSLVVGAPIPILIALMLNEVRSAKYKKTIQTIIYAPHFISTVVMSGMIIIMLSPSSGVINTIIKALGGEAHYFMIDPNAFRHIYVWSGVWQSVGWNSIIYLAALSAVNIELHEAAMIDGASRVQRIWYLNFPTLMPTFTILLILSVGSIMNVGFEKVLLLQTSLNKTTANIISTYVYERGLIKAEYDFASAIGLFNNAINFILLLSVNFIARRLGDTSLF